MDYKAGIVHLSSSGGAVLEIPEGKLSLDDLNYLRPLDVYKKEKRKVTSHLFCFPVYSLRLFGAGIQTRCVSYRSACCCFLRPDSIWFLPRLQTIGWRAWSSGIPPHLTRKPATYTAISDFPNFYDSAGSLGSGTCCSVERG